MDDVVGAPASGWEGGRAPARARRARLDRRGRDPRAPAPAPAGALGRAVERRLDLPRGPELHLPAPLGRARRGLRCRDVLRHALGRAAAEDDPPRLRRSRLPAERGAGAPRASEGACRPRGGAALAVPRALRARAGGPLPVRRRGGARLRDRAGDGGGDRPTDPPSPPEGGRESGRGSSGLPFRAADPGRAPPGSATPAPRRARRSGEPRGLRRSRRIPGAPARPRDRARGDRRRDARLEAPGPRRRRLPRRPQVGGGREAARAPPLSRLQRRRVGARHVQRPRPPRRGPVLDRRGHDDRRLRDGLRDRLSLRPRRVSRGARAHLRRDRGGARGRIPRRRNPRLGLPVRRRGAARRRRLHLRRGDGALQLDRRIPRRAAQQAPFPRREGPLRQAHCHQQRRDARQRPGHRARRRRRRSPRSARRSRRDRSSSVSRATSRGRACTRSPSARRSAG